MVETTIGNVRLNLEDIQRLAEVEGRLSNLQSEINNHTKILRGVQMECDRAVRERAYQGELLVTITSQVESKKAVSTQLDESLLEKNAQMSNLVSLIRTKTEEFQSKTNEFQKRESELIEKESEFAKNMELLSKNTKNFSETSDLFNKKVAKLKEILAGL